MDELFGQLQQILNTDEGQQQLKSVMELFGGSSEEAPDFSTLFGGQSAPESENKAAAFDPSMLLGLQQLLSGLNTEDDNTRLLVALKPHFKEERRKKVDRAVRLLGLLTIWPILKDSGMLGGLFDA